MSFIQFESATKKEQARQELRKAREELLAKAKQNAEIRAKKEVEKQLKGENNWMLPDLIRKIENQSKEDHKKEKKKSKKSSKEKKSKRERKKSKKQKYDKTEKKKKKRKHKSSSDDDENSDSDISKTDSDLEDEWVEKKSYSPSKEVKRDDWMTGPFLLPTYSKKVETTEKEKMQIDSYDPAKSSRELNPYWKDGGKGLPSFQKPKDDEDVSRSVNKSFRYKSSGNWRKKPETSSRNVETSHRYTREKKLSTSSSSGSDRERTPPLESKPVNKEATVKQSSKFLTDQEMNELGAKLIKAEIMGNDDLVKELKEKLEKARNTRNEFKTTKSLISPTTTEENKTENVLLTTTDSKGVTRPLPKRSALTNDPYSNKKSRRKNVDTHEDGNRTKYFPDDDRYDIKQMFEREKYTTASASDEQFAQIAGKYKNSKDDLEDIFADKIRKKISEQEEEEEKERKRAIQEYEKFSNTLESCDKCLDSTKMEKKLLVSMGSKVYLALPWHEPLQTGHCLIVPIEHNSCSTQLDEDTWSEINDFRKALTRMFAARSMDVIFFEMARYLNKRPHMVIHCIPSKNFEMAPFYFKKSIQESEQMWSTNKQLITLKDKNLRQSIPKGLPYFWVHFGMESGFAHVIEDQNRFPSNFSQEIIGGMLQLDPRLWRKPRREQNAIQKVKQFADWWKSFDCTS